MHSGKGILLADARIELEEIGKLTGNLKTSETDAEIDTLGGLICSIIGRVPGGVSVYVMKVELNLK